MRVKKGFTLLEIIVALGIIGIMMIPLANSLISSVRYNKMGEIVQESKQISQEIVEKIRSLGDVKEATLEIGKNDDVVDIKSVVGSNNSKFTVKGEVDDIKLDGTIERTVNGGEIIYESDRYLKEKVNVLFYAYSDSRVSADNKNKIAYSYSKEAKAINEHIADLENKIRNAGTVPTGNFYLEDSNKINFDFYDKGKCPLKDDPSKDHSECNFLIEDRYKDNSSVKGKRLCFALEATPDSNSIAILVRNHREVYDPTNPSTANNPLMGLKIRNQRTETLQPRALFLNNRFEAVESVKEENLNPGYGEIKNSFDKDKSIDSNIIVVDNIKYLGIDNLNNKGLYTISLNTERNDIKERTVSEFIVSN